MKKMMIFLTIVLLAAAFTVPAYAAGFPIAYEGLADEEKPIYGVLEAHIDDLKRDKEVLAYYTDKISGTTRAKVAFEYDHPEIFWAEYLSASSGSDGTRGKRIVCKINNYCYGPEGNRDLAADEAFLQRRVQEICDAARRAGPTRYDQLLYIHDWLTTHNRYNSAASAEELEMQEEYLEEYKTKMDRTPWNALSALSDDTEPVCEGYTYAFKLLCDELGIPCTYVPGRGHAWNYVMMEDGNWYGVDVTWDDISVSGVYNDRSGYENHDYFLKGRASFFRNDRQETTLAYIYPEQPKICETDYVPGAYSGDPVPYTAPDIDMSIAYNQTPPTPTPAVTATPAPTPAPVSEGSGGNGKAPIIGGVILLIIIFLVMRSKRRG